MFSFTKESTIRLPCFEKTLLVSEVALQNCMYSAWTKQLITQNDLPPYLSVNAWQVTQSSLYTPVRTRQK